MTQRTSHRQDPRDAKARKWRLLTVSAGLVLAAAFFLPAIQACNSPLVPAEMAYELIADGWERYAHRWPDYVSDLFGGIGMYVTAYAFGALMALAAAARLTVHRRWHKACSIGLLGLLLVDCAVLLTLVTILLATEGIPSLSEILDNWQAFLVFVVAPALVLAYVILTVRLRPRAFLCHMFVGSLAALLWFGYWFLEGVTSGNALYGLYLSLAAAWVLLVSTIGEARAVTRHSWRRTIWQLMTCRLRDATGWQGHCPGCDYYLFGLTAMRCPECGRPFSFDELGVSPETLGFTVAREV